jgi:hypothetical protein
MEAVSQGAAQEGGHVIGITCDEIEAWRPVKPNKWLQEEIRFPSVLERLSALINYCDGALALPGGVGTLAEVAVMWVQLQTKAIQARPFILIGTAWEKTFSQLYKTQNDHIPMQHRKYISFARDEVTAFQLLQELFKSSSV